MKHVYLFKLGNVFDIQPRSRRVWRYATRRWIDRAIVLHAVHAARRVGNAFCKSLLLLWR